MNIMTEPLEIAEYKKKIREHPARKYMRKIVDENRRNNVYSVVVEFDLSDIDYKLVSTHLAGVSIKNPEDTYDRRVARLVAIHSALQRCKSYL